MNARPGQPLRRRRAEVERRPPPPTEAPSRRSFGLGFWAALLAGAWIGRVSVALPEGLGTLFDLILPLAAGLFVFLSYRRFIRTRLDASRAAARRQRARRSAGRDGTT